MAFYLPSVAHAPQEPTRSGAAFDFVFGFVLCLLGALAELCAIAVRTLGALVGYSETLNSASLRHASTPHFIKYWNVYITRDWTWQKAKFPLIQQNSTYCALQSDRTWHIACSNFPLTSIKHFPSDSALTVPSWVQIFTCLPMLILACIRRFLEILSSVKKCCIPKLILVRHDALFTERKMLITVFNIITALCSNQNKITHIFCLRSSLKFKLSSFSSMAFFSSSGIGSSKQSSIWK